MAKKTELPLFLRTEAIAERYGLNAAYLRKLRMRRAGPPYRKGDGKIVVYPVDEFEEWFQRAFPAVQPGADLI